jgi:hypothetical protein
MVKVEVDGVLELNPSTAGLGGLGVVIVVLGFLLVMVMEVILWNFSICRLGVSWCTG